MRMRIIILLTLLTMTSCYQNTANHAGGQVSVDREVFTSYSKSDSILHVARALTVDGKTFDFLLYDVDISKPEKVRQKQISVEQLTQQQLDTKKAEIQTIYNWSPFDGNDILFVQIQPTGFKNEMELLDKRQHIEVELTSELGSKKLGEWAASDLGPGGGNILFAVTNVEDALQTILQFLKRNNLDKNVLIGRRILISSDDWFYEVIYPTKYSGDFNTM